MIEDPSSPDRFYSFPRGLDIAARFTCNHECPYGAVRQVDSFLRCQLGKMESVGRRREYDRTLMLEQEPKAGCAGHPSARETEEACPGRRVERSPKSEEWTE
jgi:hypothetical protein